jgi:hypothetical protein
MNGDALSNIIPQINTPLSLAALLIVAIGSIYLAAARNRNRDVSRQLFWLVLAFGIMGNAAYFANSWLLADKVILGTVRDKASQQTITNAIIDFEGVGRSASNSDGTFQISVPYSRQRKAYSVYGFADGYPTQKVSGPDGMLPGLVTIYLERHNPKFEDFAILNNRILVTQLIGNPVIGFGMAIKTTASQVRSFSNMSLDVTFPDGDTRTFYINSMTKGGMPYLNSNVTVMDNKGVYFEMYFQSDPMKIASLQQDFSQQFQATIFDCMRFGDWQGPQAQFFEERFDGAFAWVPGTYTIAFSIMADEQSLTATSSFTISQSESLRLKAMHSRVAKCSTIAALPNGMPNYQYADGSASNSVQAKVSF